MLRLIVNPSNQMNPRHSNCLSHKYVGYVASGPFHQAAAWQKANLSVWMEGPEFWDSIITAGQYSVVSRKLVFICIALAFLSCFNNFEFCQQALNKMFLKQVYRGEAGLPHLRLATFCYCLFFKGTVYILVFFINQGGRLPLASFYVAFLAKVVAVNPHLTSKRKQRTRAVANHYKLCSFCPPGCFHHTCCGWWC